jgi:hypothetical protein
MRHFSKQLTPQAGMIMTAAALCGLAFAQTGLTTIQDTLFKADGTRFSGTLTIQWSTFDSTVAGTVVQQSKSVPVVNGNLQVQLVPNAGAPAPANVYTVHYQSEGSQQFTESWTIPPSVQALTVAAVRTGMIVSSGGSASNSTPIVESAVVGLVTDLAQRPTKGPGFGLGSVAVINQNGQIETASGDVGDCVFVDGTAGPCGSEASAFFDGEIPGGLVDGSNTTFTLANPPSGSSLSLFRNGMYMLAGQDYTLTGSSLEFTPGFPPPQPGDTLVASYRIDPSAGSLSGIAGAIAAGPAPGSGEGQSVVMAQVLCSANGRSIGAAAWTSLGSCDIPASRLNPGDRVEVRFNFAHTGSASEFDIQVSWGITTILARHGGRQDAAVVGQAEASLSAAATQVTVESWGTVLGFLPGIVSSPVQSGLRVDLLGQVTNPGSDSISLTGYTVLRYPGH